MRASSEDNLTMLLKSDPAVQHGTFTVEIHPLSVFYDGCVTKQR
jgi:hypothetical protein